LISNLGQAFRTDLPDLGSMDEYLDWMIPKIRPRSEDLHEEEHFTGRAWMEFRDTDKFHDSVLHFFNPGGEYLISVNGDVSAGHWRILEQPNKFLLEHKERDSEAELFDLAYMDRSFFILKKHGDHLHSNRAKYFVLAHEPLAKRLEWIDLMELMYDTYRSNNQVYLFVAAVVLLSIVLILLLSFS